MSILSRTPLTPGARRAARTRRRPRMLACAVATTAVVLASAAPAGAVVKTIEGTEVGLQPRNSSSILDGVIKGNASNLWSEYPQSETFGNPSGNPVLHSSNVYAVYWDPTDHYHGDWQNLINGFLQSLGAESGSLNSVFAVDSQYTDKSNAPASYRATFRGAYTDTHAYPSAVCADPQPLAEFKVFHTKAITCLTDAQLREELQSFILLNGLQKGMGSIYYILTPPGVAVCLDGGGEHGHCSDVVHGSSESEANSFCSYHSAINPGGLASGDANTILYAAIPWSAGGKGDGQFAEADQTSAVACQDGGFNPVSEPIELRETTPIQQEPNQVQCPSPDGFCDSGLADIIINQIAVEQQNTVTDPLMNAWQDEASPSAHNEATDECRNFFAPALGSPTAPNEETDAGTLYNQVLGGKEYYLNTAFDLAALRLDYPGVPCLPGVVLEPKFTAPNTVNPGEIVGFDGMASNISLNAAVGYSPGGAPESSFATYTWNFGDGTSVSGFAPGAPGCVLPWVSPCAASVFHTYQTGGTYEVTLTVRDVGGNTAEAHHLLTVNTPPKEQGGALTTTTTQSTGGTSAVLPAPVALAAVTSHSLRTVLRKGLVIRYSVSEQVAGRFEVLLARSTARSLGIAGTPAVGLPAGTPPSLVIAKAVLVTTKGGVSTVVIHFSKRTAARLARRKKVSLMLRMIVRNASPKNPLTTTVLSSFTLSH